MGFFSSDKDREEAVSKTKDSWFKSGHLLGRDDERGKNEGFGRREIRGLRDENAKPWGRSQAANTVKRRAEDAGKKEEDRSHNSWW